MNHNVLIWLLENVSKKFTPVEWAERCRLPGIDWRKWDRVTMHPAEDCYVNLEAFALDYQRYNIAR